jgi:hypothetical protein
MPACLPDYGFRRAALLATFFCPTGFFATDLLTFLFEAVFWAGFTATGCLFAAALCLALTGLTVGSFAAGSDGPCAAVGDSTACSVPLPLSGIKGFFVLAIAISLFCGERPAVRLCLCRPIVVLAVRTLRTFVDRQLHPSGPGPQLAMQ